jgi:Cdc6-like AAA superfamily ATPase
MMQNFSHIHPKFQHIAVLSDAERIEFINTARWIGYQSAKDILQRLEDLFNFPKRPRMPNLMIVGESNNGKTTLVQHFYEKYKEPYETEDLELVIPLY